VTHRLNVAAECVGKFPEEKEGKGDTCVLKTVHVPMRDLFGEDCDDEVIAEWVAQLGQALDILREWKKEGAVVNINCQMGKNRSGAAVAIWMCRERGWGLMEAVLKLREITALACGNPHIIKALTIFLDEPAAEVPLNPAGDGGGWICISPPGSPRAGSPDPDSNQPCENIAQAAFEKLAALEEKQEEESEKLPEDFGGLFEDIADA